jgi:hypothetical protein
MGPKGQVFLTAMGGSPQAVEQTVRAEPEPEIAGFARKLAPSYLGWRWLARRWAATFWPSTRPASVA